MKTMTKVFLGALALFVLQFAVGLTLFALSALNILELKDVMGPLLAVECGCAALAIVTGCVSFWPEMREFM